MTDPNPTKQVCDECTRLRKLTREGKARTYGISLSGGLQLPLDEAEREAWEVQLSDLLHGFTGGWTIVELPDDEQVEYLPEEECV